MIPRQEKELEAACLDPGVRQETAACPRGPQPRLQTWEKGAHGFQSEALDLPPSVCTVAKLELTPAVGAHCHSSCSWAMDSCCQDMDLVLITVSANTVNLLLQERVFENVHSGYNFSASPAVCAQLIPDTVLWNSNHCIYKKARTHKYVTSGIYNAIFHHFLF